MRNLIDRLMLFYKNLGIKRKLLLLFFIQIIIPLFFIGYTSYQKSAEIIKDKSISYSQDILKMIELRFNDLSENMKVLSMELLYDSRIYDFLSESSNIKDNLSIYSHASEIKGILRQATMTRNEIQSICLVTKDRKYFSFDSNNAVASIQQMMPYGYLLEKARDGRGKLVWLLDKKGESIENVYVTRVIYDRDSFEEIGFLAILIKKEFIESVYRDLSSESLTNISILSENNEEIIRGDMGQSSLLSSFFKRQLQDRKGYYIDKETDTLVSYILLKDPKWKIVYHIPLKDLYREMDALKRWVYLVLIYGVIIMSMLSVLTSIDIIAPINKLVAGMKKLEKGAKHEDIQLNRGDELGYMSESFNRMSKKIDYLVNQIYREEIALKEAEIKALQAQINPHFLFNTLENVNWMAQLNGVPEISETVSALANLIDANIGRDDRLIPLREELEYVDNYMTILKNRYEGRLEVIKQIEPALLRTNIPRLLLQPLVENAIKHGIEKSRGNGKITLNAYRSGEDIIIEVMDNGAGMTEEALLQLNQQLEKDHWEEHKAHKRKSVGLENVNRRIKLLYGSRYGLKIESQEDEYTKVYVVIPDEQKLEEGA